MSVQSLERPMVSPFAVDEAGAIDEGFVTGLERKFDDNAKWRLAQNAVTQTSVIDVAMNRRVLTGIDHTFSHKLDDWEVTNQKKSGRCWMFAALNLFRVKAMQAMKLKSFEFSQNYTLFWDKFERANYFLEAMIETADRDLDDRTVGFLLDRPVDDGGQWNMFVNLVKKHGLVPKAMMPESQSSSETMRMNAVLTHRLRAGAKELRELRNAGAPMEACRNAKREILEAIHRILCIHLGTPPRSFIWQWNDDDGEFHRDGAMTPQSFAEKYVQLPIEDYVCLVHDPRPSSPAGKTFTVQHLGNVVGGEIVTYLNVELGLMKRLAMEAIADRKEPVWFGCDVGKMMRRDLGVWDRELFDYEGLYDTTFDLDKAERLMYRHSQMTHAMLFTGVDIVEDRSRRWRVENSWGDENGRKGFYAMNDSWFDEFVLEIAAPKSALPSDLREALEAEPIVLAPWDPMGALARVQG